MLNSSEFYLGQLLFTSLIYLDTLYAACVL